MQYLSDTPYVLNDNMNTIIESYYGIIEPRIKKILEICNEHNSIEEGHKLLINCANYDCVKYENYLNGYPIKNQPIGDMMLYFNTMLCENKIEVLSQHVIYKDLFKGQVCIPPKTEKDRISAINQIQGQLRTMFKEILKNKLYEIKNPIAR